MRKIRRMSLEELILQNKKDLLNNKYELDKIDEKIEQKRAALHEA